MCYYVWLIHLQRLHRCMPTEIENNIKGNRYIYERSAQVASLWIPGNPGNCCRRSRRQTRSTRKRRGKKTNTDGSRKGREPSRRESELSCLRRDRSCARELIQRKELSLLYGVLGVIALHARVVGAIKVEDTRSRTFLYKQYIHPLIYYSFPIIDDIFQTSLIITCFLRHLTTRCLLRILANILQILIKSEFFYPFLC